MSYSIKILRSSEFDRLPYSRVREAFGVTSPDKSTIYVRNTNIHDFNKMLVSHELDHLTEEVPTDVGPDGERYFLGSILPFLGSLFTKALPAIGGGIANLGRSAISGIGNVASRVGSGASSLLSGAKSGVMNLFGGGGQQTANTLGYGNSVSPIAMGVRKGMTNAAGGFSPLMKGTELSQFVSPIRNMGGGITSGAVSGLQKTLGSTSTGSGTQEEETGEGKNFLDMFKNPQTALGAGMIGASLFKKPPQVGQLPESLQQAQGMSSITSDPRSAFARDQLSGMIGESFDPLTDPEIQAYNRQLDLEKKQAIDRTNKLYASLQPGSSTSDSGEYRRDIQLIEDQFAQAKSDAVANRTRDLKQQYVTNKLQAMQMEFGLSAADIQNRFAAAQYDVDRMYQQLQIDVANANFSKSTLGGVGQDLLIGGLTNNSPMSFWNPYNMIPGQ